MEHNLNLARKWRSKKFKEIIGQGLSVRMLLNSLYKGHYFPVYLFSGQRGCGKTTTARVFAAAINCEQLELFRKDPKKYSIPCLQCKSCKAMQTGKHPDFIEMDAASHTGVDMMRQVIDASSFLPLMGTKKIYLIDEAHMLSKAAFNALLKILEEPPASVLFILATTDPHKIIDTVKSRCFQLFFRPINTPVLSDYLREICFREQIKYEDEALMYITKETEGSVRDALNLLEQVRFSAAMVTKQAVLQVLGYLDNTQLIDLFTCVLQDNTATLLQKIKEIKLDTYAPEFIWRKLVDLSRALLWVKHGVEPQYFTDHVEQLKRLVTNCSFKRLNEVLDILYSNEGVFLKTTAKYALLEMILLQLSQDNNGSDGSSAPQQAAAPAPPTDDDEEYAEDEQEYEEEEEEEEKEDEFHAKWTAFVKEVTALQDPLLNSVFSQGTCIGYDQNAHKLDIEFSKDLSFFSDWMNQSYEQWFPLLQKVFTTEVVFNPLFVGANKTNDKKVSEKVDTSQTQVQIKPEYVQVAQQKTTSIKQSQQRYQVNNGYQRRSYGNTRLIKKEPIIDVSDIVTWKKANLVLQYFPGTVHEIRE